MFLLANSFSDGAHAHSFGQLIKHLCARRLGLSPNQSKVLTRRHTNTESEGDRSTTFIVTFIGVQSTLSPQKRKRFVVSFCASGMGFVHLIPGGRGAYPKDVATP